MINDYKVREEQIRENIESLTIAFRQSVIASNEFYAQILMGSLARTMIEYRNVVGHDYRPREGLR